MYRKFTVIILLIMVLAAVNFPGSGRAADEDTRTVIDMAGRTVVIPRKITKVFSTSPMGTILMYTLAPDKIAGLSWPVTDMEKRFTLPSYQKLPLLGGMFGGKKNTMNPELIIKTHPDFILSLGDITRLDMDTAERLQAQLHIPVFMADGGFEKIGEVYQRLGEILDTKTRATRLAAYWEKITAGTKTVIAKIPLEKRVRVYYAEAVNGLETDPANSRHAEVLTLAGGINVADVPEQRGYGRTQVSMEQLLEWNPELIIVCSDQGFSQERFYTKIFADPLWSNLKAVKNKEVYEIPFAPFNWFDRPPSVNRIIGVVWLRQLLYPQYFKTDIIRETQEFYQLFYHRKLSAAEVDEILANSMRR